MGKITNFKTIFRKQLFLVLISTVLMLIIIMAQPLVAAGLRSFEVSEIAKKFTVSIEGHSSGSGVIVRKDGSNNYQVMTAWHVIKEKGKYSIRTFDDKYYPVNVNPIQPIPLIDIGIVEFTSETQYPIVESGDSKKLKEGMTVFVPGYPTSGPLDQERNYTFLEAKITTFSKKLLSDGYSLGYDNFALNGMSGSPVLNEDAKLVAIHGATQVFTLMGASGNYGIENKTFRNWQEKALFSGERNVPTSTVTQTAKDPQQTGKGSSSSVSGSSQSVYPSTTTTGDSNISSSSRTAIGISGTLQPNKKSNLQNIKFIWPTTGIIQSIGRRWGRMNRGIEIYNSGDTPIYAVADGVVQKAGWSSGEGNLIVIRHANELLTYYGHNSKNLVESGKKVIQGEKIALMGSTGYSTGIHLHFEVREFRSDPNPDFKGVSIDPIPLLPPQYMPIRKPFLISLDKNY